MEPRPIERLFEVAVDQDGVFTADQATSAGVSKVALNRLTKRNAVIRLGRGIYRLGLFPNSGKEQYREALLWPSINRRQPVFAALSHVTALLLHGVSDVSPAKIDVVVPAKTRLRKRIPETFTFHRASLQRDEVVYIEGLPVTALERTLKDCSEADIGPQVLADALRDAVRKHLITSERAGALANQLGVQL